MFQTTNQKINLIKQMIQWSTTEFFQTRSASRAQTVRSLRGYAGASCWDHTLCLSIHPDFPCHSWENSENSLCLWPFSIANCHSHCQRVRVSKLEHGQPWARSQLARCGKACHKPTMTGDGWSHQHPRHDLRVYGIGFATENWKTLLLMWV